MSQSKNILIATDDNFESDVLKSDLPALVDFWAEWCGPCRILGPTIETIADEYQGKLKVFKMDVDAHPNAAAQYHIRSIPTVILFKGGKPVDQFLGNNPKDFIKKFLDKNI